MKDQQRNGFALISGIVGLGILTIVLLALVAFFRTVGQSSQEQRILASRDLVATSIRKNAGLPASLRNSVRQAVNVSLQACIDANSATNCTNGQKYPLVLFGPDIQLQPGGGTLAAGPIAGAAAVGNTAAGPLVLYDADGLPCITGETLCPIAAQTSFIGYCPMQGWPSAPPYPLTSLLPTPTCNVADNIEVQYSVFRAPNTTSLTFSFESLAGSTALSVYDIMGW